MLFRGSSNMCLANGVAWRCLVSFPTGKYPFGSKKNCPNPSTPLGPRNPSLNNHFGWIFKRNQNDPYLKIIWLKFGSISSISKFWLVSFLPHSLWHCITQLLSFGTVTAVNFCLWGCLECQDPNPQRLSSSCLTCWILSWVVPRKLTYQWKKYEKEDDSFLSKWCLMVPLKRGHVNFLGCNVFFWNKNHLSNPKVYLFKNTSWP